MATLSVITPTVGRASLRYTLASVTTQLLDGDEVLVCGDGPQPAALYMAQNAGSQVRYLQTIRPTHQWGNAQRDLAISQAKGEYLAFLDDDDQWTPGARQAIEQAIAEHPGHLFLFRMQLFGYSWCAPGAVLWRKEGELDRGKLGTPMFVCPNDRERLVRWVDTPDPLGYSADWWFITGVIGKYPSDRLIWREDVIAVCRKTN